MSNAARVELETRLAAFAAAQTPALPIAWEGVPFTKPSTGGYLEAFLLSANTINPTVDGKRKRDLGIFQVIVYFPDGSGVGTLETVAQGIVDAFPVVPQSSTVVITNTPSTTHTTPDTSGWRWLPVSIPYRIES